MLCAESRVTTNVTVMLPEPPDSPLVIAGTSFAGRRSAVNVGLVGVDVLGEVELFEQAATPRASTATRTDKRFIVISFTADRSKELARKVEPQIESRRRSAARHLREGRRERIGESQREEVTADALLDAEAVLRVAGRIAGDAWRHFAD